MEQVRSLINMWNIKAELAGAAVTNFLPVVLETIGAALAGDKSNQDNFRQDLPAITNSLLGYNLCSFWF